MRTVIMICMLISVLSIAAYGADQGSGGEDFLSSTMGSVLDKVNQYTSGQKSLFDPESDKPGRAEEYTTDALGNRVLDTSVRSGKISSSDKSL